MRFGRLVAVRLTKERSNGGVVWECRCDCGNTCKVTGRKLRNGNTRSCGCLRLDSARAKAEVRLAAEDEGHACETYLTDSHEGIMADAYALVQTLADEYVDGDVLWVPGHISLTTLDAIEGLLVRERELALEEAKGGVSR